MRHAVCWAEARAHEVVEQVQGETGGNVRDEEAGDNAVACNEVHGADQPGVEGAEGVREQAGLVAGLSDADVVLRVPGAQRGRERAVVALAPAQVDVAHGVVEGQHGPGDEGDDEGEDLPAEDKGDGRDGVW